MRRLRMRFVLLRDVTKKLLMLSLSKHEDWLTATQEGTA